MLRGCGGTEVTSFLLAHSPWLVSAAFLWTSILPPDTAAPGVGASPAQAGTPHTLSRSPASAGAPANRHLPASLLAGLIPRQEWTPRSWAPTAGAEWPCLASGMCQLWSKAHEAAFKQKPGLGETELGAGPDASGPGWGGSAQPAPRELRGCRAGAQSGFGSLFFPAEGRDAPSVASVGLEGAQSFRPAQPQQESGGCRAVCHPEERQGVRPRPCGLQPTEGTSHTPTGP